MRLDFEEMVITSKRLEDSVDLHLQSDWHRAIGQYVEIRLRGKAIRTGTVEAVMPDGSILWISAEGASSREMVERAEGKEVFARYAWDVPPPREAITISLDPVGESAARSQPAPKLH